MEDFLDAFAAFFSFAVKSGFFLVVFLLSWPLLMVVSFSDNLKNLTLIRANFEQPLRTYWAQKAKSATQQI